MDSLNQARMTIDSVDREMAKLFAERMQAAAVIAAYKEEHGLPVEDIAREDELIARDFRTRSSGVQTLITQIF